MKNKIKFITYIFFLFLYNNLFSYEIIRDPIFEDYFIDLSKDLKLNKINVYLIKDNSANAFVIDNKIYFTTGLLDVVDNEDTIKAIYLHEYGHVIKNHSQIKRIIINKSEDMSSFTNMLSLGLAVITGSSDIAIGTNITLNSSVLNDISKHSINYEIEADNFMIEQIKKNEINTTELISFLDNTINSKNNYFRTHPRSKDRINILSKFNYQNTDNSDRFNWIKSKYTNSSKNKTYNRFFKDLERGIYTNNKEINNINKLLLEYEAFKKGFFIKDWDINFQKLLNINESSFLKLEYINYLLDNDLKEKYNIIEDFKFDKKIMSEYFYYYIYGKYYSKIGSIKLSNFYFCQFYKTINSHNKADFFCKKYDIKDIPTLDRSYALFK